MGLPIWNYTDEVKPGVEVKDTAKIDSTASHRSNIRRRASIHGRHRNTSNTRADSTLSALTRAYGSNSTLSSADMERLRPARNDASDSTTAPLPSLLPVPEPSINPRQIMRDESSTLGREGPQFVPRDYHDSQAPYHAEPVSRTRPSIHPTRPAAAMARRAARRRELQNLSAARPTRGSAVPRTNLPTPPLDNDLSSILPTPAEILARNNTPPMDNDLISILPTPAQILVRNNHVASPDPYSSVQSHDSLDNRLGDRTRSVSPSIDVWQVMRSTITPDETLPSTSSSFTGAAAANASFASLAHPENRQLSHQDSSSEPDEEGDSDTNHDDSEDSSDDDSEMGLTQENSSMERIRIAMHLYDLAMRSSQGRGQVEAQRRRIRESNTSAPQHPTSLPSPPFPHSQDDQIDSPTLPLPEPEQFGTAVNDRAQEASFRVHAYFGSEHQDEQQDDMQDETVETDLRQMSRMLIDLNNNLSRTPVAGPRARELDQMREAIRAMTERTLSSTNRLARAIHTIPGETAESHGSNHNYSHVSSSSQSHRARQLPADHRS